MMDNSAEALVVLTPGFPESEEDSTCLPAQQLFVKCLKNIFPSLQVIVVTFQYPFTQKPYLWHGCRVIPFNGRNRGKLSRLSIWMQVFLELTNLSKKYKITGLFSFWCADCALVGKYFAKYKGIKHLCWISGQDAEKSNKYISFIRPKATELVAKSEFLALRFYKNHHVLPGFIIPNGIDAGQFSTQAVTRDIDIAAVGSLIKLKQYELLIDIVGELKSQLPGIKTIVCGKGPEKDNLQNTIGNRQLEKNIELAGELSHQNILKVMQRSKVFLHPSRYEGYSSVCLEALYAGAHVISFWQPDNKKVMHWHVVKNKEEMFIKTLEILLSPETVYKPVMVQTMEDSARAVMKLFKDESGAGL